MEFFRLLCDAAKLFNGTHATDERVFVRPAKKRGARKTALDLFNWKEKT